LYINPNLTQVENIINRYGFSRKDFSEGIKTYIGLDNKKQSTLNYVIILPELQKFVNKYL
jgi:hypothetical protein